MMTVTLRQTLQQMLHMWSRTACEKDPWKAQVVEFALGPWRESCGLFLGNSHVWFTVATPSYQSSNHFSRFGLFFKDKTWKPRNKTYSPLESVPHSSSWQSFFQSPKKSCCFSQYWPWVGEPRRDRLPGPRGGFPWCSGMNWVGLCCLSRIQDSQRHHRSDWWGTAWGPLLLFREGGKRRPGPMSDMETALLPSEMGCSLSTRAKC